jgi:hypothetical protein
MEPFIYAPMPTPTVVADGKHYYPANWNVFCPVCGHLWARRFLVDDVPRPWQYHAWPCLACGHGSLWDSYNKAWNVTLPPDLVLRELDIIQNWYDQGINTYLKYFQYKHFRRKV